MSYNTLLQYGPLHLKQYLNGHKQRSRGMLLFTFYMITTKHLKYAFYTP